MKIVFCYVVAVCVLFGSYVPALASGTKSFTLAVSSYVGWMPWFYADQQGIIKKWAKRYGVDITVKYMDYVPSVETYVSGKSDAALMTNMETLDMAAASGLDSSVIILGDYSNGNDAVLVRDNVALKDLKGKKIYLAERTVSQYVLTRALEKARLKESDVHTVNVSENDIASLAEKHNVVVTWNPMVMQIEKVAGTHKLFDSSEIPGEIQDLLVVNSHVLKTNPDFARALVGAWYEVMGMLNKNDLTRANALKKMAALARTTQEDFNNQLKTTSMFYTPKSALDYLRSPEIKQKQDNVRKFCFSHGLLGDNSRTVNDVGIIYPDGTVYGDKKNIKMRYVDTFLSEAAEGKI